MMLVRHWVMALVMIFWEGLEGVNLFLELWGNLEAENKIFKTLKLYNINKIVQVCKKIVILC